MNAIPEQTLTVEAFETFVKLPENADKRFEWVGGEMVEVPSNAYCSMIAMQIAALLVAYVNKHNLGYVTGGASGYMVDGERYAPDAKQIEVYAPGQSLVVVDVNGVVEGGAVLPGFSLAVKDVFRVAPE